MTTKHNHQPNFGRRVADCPRCAELNNGAEPVVWSISKRAELDRRHIESIRMHNCKTSGCGPVCTFGDY